MRTSHLFLLMVFALSTVCRAQTTIDKTYKVVYSQSFSKDKSTNDFDFSDDSKWLISKNGKPGKALKCLGKGEFESAHSGPAVVAVLKQFELSDFILEMDVVQNGKDFSLLDFCIFFGIQDREHYCFAQLASKADKKNHNIFMVDGDKPKRVGAINEKGVIWKMKTWQKLRLERLAADKSVKVYMNDELILEATDELFNTGHIGFGSSNSAIKVDNLKISAPSHEINPQTFF